jgi:GH15 family glucan-1,4-alpha-glucosidase
MGRFPHGPQRMHRTRRLSGRSFRFAFVGLLTVLLLGPGAANGRLVASAPGGPGALSHFDLARKDCLGTARNTTSKVWYTVANGVLSDVYFPTVDNTNVETLQYVVTDGATFTDLQTRDMTYTVRALDPGGMECRVTTTAKSGRYRILTDYLTDPSRNTVLLRTSFEPLVPAAASDRLYVRLDSTVNGNGGGGGGNGGADSGTVDTSTGHPVLVASDPMTATQAVNRDYAQPVYLALDASRPFDQVTNGFAGTASDGLTQLDSAHALTTTYSDAANGNLVQIARLPQGASGFTLALGFGGSQMDAVQTAEQSLADGFPAARSSYEHDWAQYDAGLKEPPGHFAGIANPRWKDLVSEYFLSANVVKASEDKTFPGAIVASLASPWGQAVSAGDPANTYFGSYREVFARDLYEAWTGLFLDGDLATARDAVKFLFDRQQLVDGSFPRNSARQLRHAARRGRLPDPDGVPARYDRREPLRESHQAGGELPDCARAGVRRRALGGAGRLLAVDDRGRDRRARRGRPARAGKRRRCLRRALPRRR